MILTPNFNADPWAGSTQGTFTSFLSFSMPFCFRVWAGTGLIQTHRQTDKQTDEQEPQCGLLGQSHNNKTQKQEATTSLCHLSSAVAPDVTHLTSTSSDPLVRLTPELPIPPAQSNCDCYYETQIKHWNCSPFTIGLMGLLPVTPGVKNVKILTLLLQQDFLFTDWTVLLCETSVKSLKRIITINTWEK